MPYVFSQFLKCPRMSGFFFTSFSTVLSFLPAPDFEYPTFKPNNKEKSRCFSPNVFYKKEGMWAILTTLFSLYKKV